MRKKLTDVLKFMKENIEVYKICLNVQNGVIGDFFYFLGIPVIGGHYYSAGKMGPPKGPHFLHPSILQQNYKVRTPFLMFYTDTQTHTHTHTHTKTHTYV